MEELKSKLDIKTFVDKYNKCITDPQRAAVLSEIKIKKYVPYSTKSAVAIGIAKKTIKFIDGVPQKDNISKFIVVVMSVISLYTDLDVSNDKESGYDLLTESKLMDVILNEIGDDVKEYEFVIECAYSDLYENSLSTHTFIASQVTRFGNLASEGFKMLSESVSKIDMKKATSELKSFYNKAINK